MPANSPSSPTDLNLPALARFLTRAKRQASLTHLHVSLRLMGDREIRSLNRRFRHHDYPTDVLSFPDTGDLAISLPTARRQARAQQHPLQVEVHILILHGLLHLAGHDHEQDQGQMFALESRLRQALNLPNCSYA